MTKHAAIVSRDTQLIYRL